MVGRRGLVALVALLVAACTAGDLPTDPPAQPSPVATPTAGSIASGQPSPGASLTPSGPSPAPPSPTSPTDSPSPGATAAPTDTPAPGGMLDGQLGWTELLLAGGPAAREDHTFTVAGDGQRAYLFGGRAGGDAFNDLWAYDLATDAWQLVEPVGPQPEPRFGHVAAWHDRLGLIVWSGQQSATVFFGDLWAFDPATGRWSELPDAGEVPEPRYGSCGAIGPDGQLWISHGFTEDAGRFFDTRAYDFETLSWRDLTPAERQPVLRCLHDCLWAPDGRLVLYAGQTTGAPAIGDLWALDAEALAWQQAEAPVAEPRNLYALARLGDRAVVFGGQDADRSALDDLWLLDLDGLTMSQLDAGTPPPARWGGAMIADESRQRLLLFGGVRRAGELADLWVLSARP